MTKAICAETGVCLPCFLGAGEQTNFGGGLGEREAERSLPQPARVGNADQ